MSGSLPIRSLFATRLYEGQADVGGLADACRAVAAQDRAGKGWCREHGYRGYTSYASLNDLPHRDPAFADLVRALDRQVAAFARASNFRLAKRLKLDSLWINILKPGAAHSGHIHPHSSISGTVYVETPPGAGAIRFEDPRLPLMMAAPLGDERFVHVDPAPGLVLLWESWLRHEVLAGSVKAERISVSFNYARSFSPIVRHAELDSASIARRRYPAPWTLNQVQGDGRIGVCNHPAWLFRPRPTVPSPNSPSAAFFLAGSSRCCSPPPTSIWVSRSG